MSVNSTSSSSLPKATGGLAEGLVARARSGAATGGGPSGTATGVLSRDQNQGKKWDAEAGLMGGAIPDLGALADAAVALSDRLGNPELLRARAEIKGLKEKIAVYERKLESPIAKEDQDIGELYESKRADLQRQLAIIELSVGNRIAQD